MNERATLQVRPDRRGSPADRQSARHSPPSSFGISNAQYDNNISSTNNCQSPAIVLGEKSLARGNLGGNVGIVFAIPASTAKEVVAA